jgi:xanthine/CO dehydrogenase XdhC/CoxF family maturation factor
VVHPESDPRAFAPIDLGGKPPAEIAVTVVAEIRWLMNGRSERHCREIQGQDQLASRTRRASA